jgi:mRNA interferase MazF
MRFGDVFICRFPFTSGDLSKPRPVLVLFDLHADVVICRISSVAPHGPFDVPLSDWRAAGLLKPSIVRLNRLVTAETAILHARLGELSPADRDAVRSAWNKHMRL